jgi:glycosyltransferase involved in cell wall biosynthesis
VADPARPGSATVELVVPVHNEQRDLEASVRVLHRYLGRHLPYHVRIVIADNASTDATPVIARRLTAQLPGVTSIRLEYQGRGGALRAAWSASDADVLAYCDVDLSTDLAALPALLAPLVSGDCELAIGTRLAPGSTVTRSARRDAISRCYNLLLRTFLEVGFSDAQCGFKAVRAPAAQLLLPRIQDDGWFFDTELLVLAERAGLRIHEVPVSWTEDPHSSVRIVRTALADLRGMLRLGRGGGAGPRRLTLPGAILTLVLVGLARMTWHLLRAVPHPRPHSRRPDRQLRAVHPRTGG